MINLKIFILCFVIGVCYSQSCVTDDKNLDDENIRLSPRRKSTDKTLDKKLQRSLPNLLRQMRSGSQDNIKLLIDKTGNVQLRSDRIPDESVEVDTPDSWQVLQPLVLIRNGNTKHNNIKLSAEQRMKDDWNSDSSETSEITKSLKNPYDNDDVSAHKPQFKIEKSDGLLILKPINEKTNSNSNNNNNSNNNSNDNSPMPVKRLKNEDTGTHDPKEIDASLLLSLLARLQENS